MEATKNSARSSLNFTDSSCISKSEMNVYSEQNDSRKSELSGKRIDGSEDGLLISESESESEFSI